MKNLPKKYDRDVALRSCNQLGDFMRITMTNFKNEDKNQMLRHLNVFLVLKHVSVGAAETSKFAQENMNQESE